MEVSFPRSAPKVLVIMAAGAAVLYGCDNPTGSDLEITITAPPAEGDSADQSYIVEWNVSIGPWDEDEAFIDLYVDIDLDPSGGLVMIAESLGTQQTGFNWVCASFPEDDYYVRGMVYAGRYEKWDYSEGAVTVYHGGRSARGIFDL